MRLISIFFLFSVCFPLSLHSQNDGDEWKFDSLFLEAIRLKHQGEYTEALSLLQEALQIDSTSSAALYEISNYYLYLKKSDLALNALQKAVFYAPENLEYKMALADLNRELGKFEESIILYEELAKENPQKPELHYYLSTLYLQQRQINKAIEALNALENNIGMNETISLQKFQLYIMTDKKEDAVNEIKALIKKFPTEEKYPILLIDYYMQEHNPDEIIAVCDGALVYFPNTPDYYFYKGTAYLVKKDYPAALAAYKKGLPTIPAENKLLLSNFHGQIGDISSQMGKKEDAYSSYNKALEYNENNILVLNNYAYYLSLEKKDLDKAERMAAKCVRLQPDNATYIDTYAWVFFQMENYSLAKFYIENAISKGGHLNSEILEHYGDILYKTGNETKAIAEWEKALLLKDKNEDTKKLRRKIKKRVYYE
jgi:tetratricopeptide (TPR) repeat protein